MIIAISTNSQKIPEILVSSSNGEIKALKGNYTWNAFSTVLVESSFLNENYIYKNDNTILVSPDEKLTFFNDKSVGSVHSFDVSSFSNTNSDGEKSIVDYNKVSSNYDSNIEVQFSAPSTEGTYFYYIYLDYHENGHVEYSFKVVVSTEPTYNILELVKYKNTSIVDMESINEIIKILPYLRNITNVSISAQDTTNKIIISLQEISVNRAGYTNDAIALLTLIPELDVIEFKDNEVYYIFSREELQTLYNRSFTEYIDNPEIWEKEVLYKERVEGPENTKDVIFKNIIIEALSLSSGERLEGISIDTESFSNKSNIPFSKVNQEVLLDSLKPYADVIYDIPLQKHVSLKFTHPYVGAEIKEIEVDDNFSGDELEETEFEDNTSEEETTNDNYLVNIIVLKDNKEYHYQYDVYYFNNSWYSILHN